MGRDLEAGYGAWFDRGAGRSQLGPAPASLSPPGERHAAGVGPQDLQAWLRDTQTQRWGPLGSRSVSPGPEQAR